MRRSGGRQSRREAVASDALASLLFNSLGAAIDLLFRWFVGIGASSIN
jgi:hypothetical protein